MYIETQNNGIYKWEQGLLEMDSRIDNEYKIILDVGDWKYILARYNTAAWVDYCPLYKESGECETKDYNPKDCWKKYFEQEVKDDSATNG